MQILKAPGHMVFISLERSAKYHTRYQGNLETVQVIPREITNGRIKETHREN
jgi:hypothetical protein